LADCLICTRSIVANVMSGTLRKVKLRRIICPIAGQVWSFSPSIQISRLPSRLDAFEQFFHPAQCC
jgi:hypothetical protein